MNCNKVAVPGTEKPSLLYASLEQKYGEERALQLWTWAHQYDFTERDENGEPTVAAVEAALPKQEEVVNAAKNPLDFRNHSGGVDGADREWDLIGRKFGFVNHNHYREPGQTTVDSGELRRIGVKAIALDPQTYAEGKVMADKIDRILGENPNRGYGHYRYRNYGQVKFSDAVFAISSGLGIREKAVNKPFMPLDRGTIYAIVGAVLDGKPVYVFDQKAEQWYTYDRTTRKFVTTDTPTLTPNYAGIGSRTILESGKKAIEDVYKKTLESGAQSINNATEGKIETPHDFSSNENFRKIAQTEVNPLDINPEALNKQLELTAVKLPDGGYWEAAKQEQVVDSIQYKLFNLFPKAISDPALQDKLKAEGKSTLDYVKERIRNDFQKFHEAWNSVNMGKVPTMPASEYSAERVSTTRAIINSFDTDKGFWHFTMKRLENLGIKFKNDGAALESPDSATLEHVNAEAGDKEIDLQDSEGLKDWFQDSFTLDMKDTLSTAMKMFMANIENSQFTDTANLRFVQLSLNNDNTARDIASGAKKDFYINPRYAQKMGIVLSEEVNKSLTPLEQRNQYSMMSNLKGIVKLEAEKRLTEADLTPELKERVKREEGFEPEVGHLKMKVTYYPNKPAELTTEKNFLGLPTLADANSLYTETMSHLTGIEPSFSAYLKALKEAPTPNLRRVAEKIEAQPAHMQNQFVKAFSSQYRKMVMVLATRGEDGYLKMRAIDSNRGNEIDSIINTWRENQKMSTDLWETNAAGKKVLNTKLVKELADELQAILPLDRSSAEWKQRSPALFKRTLEANGIYLSDEAMQELRKKERFMIGSKTETGKKFGLSSLIGSGYTYMGKPKGIAEALIGRMKGYVRDTIETDEDSPVNTLTDEDAFKINNPLYTEKSSMRYLAGTQLKYMTRVHSNTLKSADGKTIYSYGLNTSLSHAIRQFNTDPAFKEALSKASFNKHSWLLADPTRELTLGYMDGLKNEYGSRDGVTRPDMSDREQWATVLGLFQNGHMVSLTHSDKTQTPVFLNAPILPFGTIIDVSLSLDKSLSLNSAFIDKVYQHVFMAEYERIQNQQAHNLKNYDVAKNLFYMLPILNKEHLQERLKNKQITEGHYTTIWGEDGTLNPISTPNFEKYVKQIIKAQLNKAVERTLIAWEDSKLFEDNLPGNESYFRPLLQYLNWNVRDKNYKEHFTKRDWRDGANNKVNGEGVKTTALTMAAMHYTANSFLFNTSLAQTFYGDPAGTFKPVKGAVVDGKMVAGKESASVISSMVEYGKRLAKDIAPGSDADWSDAPHYTAVTGADYEPIAREMKGTPGYEKGVPGTDAQELVTMKEYMVNLFKDGKITETQKNTALNIIANAKDGYYTFENEPTLKNVVFQPQKPVVSGMVSEGDVMRYDYIKSSAYPLYPPLTAGKEIDKLRKAMERQNVDRFAYSSAKKTGAPKEPVSLFAADGTIDEDVFKTPVWEQSKQLLNRANFRIQQEVPYEEDKDHILTVSQLNKNLVEHIATVRGTFDFQGEKLSGAELRQKKEAIRQQLIEQSHEKFMGKVGATFDAIHNPVLTNPKKLYSILAQEAATGAGYGNNDLLQLSSFVEGTNQLTVPLFLAASAGKFETKMMSLVRDIVKIKVPGHSFVQASSAGFKSIEGDTGERSGIIWTGELVTGELQTARKGDNNETIPAQILVSSAHFKRIVGQNIKDFIKDGKLELTDDQKKMMQMVLARIPNQGHSSMLVAEIVGFLPGSAADTMMVPMAITKQMGSDFDVDKVYTYNRTTDNKLMNDYFDVHWSVLTHPEMYESMMKPLDIDDAKAEADLLADKDGGYVDYFAPDYQMKDFQSMKGAKVLVGQTSLALTHNAEIQNKNIPLVTKTAEGFVDASIVVAGDDGKEIHLTHLSGYGESEYTHPKTGVKEKRSKADNIQIQQSEAVDHAKNRVVDKINLTPDTWAASNAISRLQSADAGIPGKEDFTPGQALPFSFNARLLMQPVVREFAAEMSLNNDTLSKNFIANVKESTFKGLAEKYEKLLRESLGIRADAAIPTAMQEIIDKHVFSPDSLYETIDMGRKAKPSAEFYARQLAALELFRKFDEIGSQIITLQSVMSQNTRGAGANMLDAWNVVEKTAKLQSNPSEIILGHTSSLFENTEVGTTYKRTIGTATGVFHDILPYHRVAPLYNYIQEQLGRKGVDMSPKQKADVFRGLKSFIYSDSSLGLYENAQDERKRLLFSQDGAKSLAIHVQEAKNTWGKNDHLLARLSTLIDPDGKMPDRIEYSAAKVMNGNEQEENERSWLSGLKSEDAKKRELFEDLIRYNYVTGGLQNARNFVKFIPWAAIEGSRIAEGLRQSADRLRNIAESLPLKEQLYQHNPSLTRQLTKDLSETGTPLKLGDKPGVEFSLPRIQIDSPSPADGLAIMVTADDGTTYRTLPDYVHYRDGREVKLYKAVDWGDRVVYRQIDTLGDSKSGLLEYSSQPTGEARSIIEKNRVPEVKAEIIENKSIAQRVLSQVGLPEAGGTFEDLHRSLDTIAGDRTQPEYLRTMANSLRKLQRNTVESTAYSDIFKLSKDFSIHLEDLGTADRARFDSVGNKMTFNLRSMSDRTGAAEDIIHETMHYHTGLLYAAYEGRESWEKREYSEGLKEKLEKVRKLIEENPEFKAKLDVLDAVRREAYENFNKQIIAKIGYDRWKSETAENKGEFGILHYGLSTPTEFIAHLFSNRQMIDYLNNQPATAESKGILSRIMDALKAVWGHIAQALGAKQGSKMEEAVYHALDILNYKQKLANNMLNSPASDLSLMNAHIWNNAKNPASLSTPIRKVTGKLEETRRSLIGDQTGLRDKQVSGALKSRVDKLEQQIEQLNKENDLSLIPKVAGEHLNWVDHVLANPSPSINELNAAEKLLNVWRYSQDVPFDISGRADSQMRLIVPIMQDRLIQVGAGAISTADFTPGELKDSNAIEANLRSANQSAKSKVSQLLSRYVETAVRGEDEEIRRRHITHMTLKDDMITYGKANGLKLKDVYAKLMREGSTTWRLVTEYSQDWDNYQQEIRTKRNGALNAIEAKEGLSDADKARQKAKVWERFWSDAYAKGLFVDTRKFFEPETGELKTGKEFDNARATLVREYGEEKAARLINEAQEKYKKYVEDRANRLQVLDDTLSIDLQNVEGMPEDTEEQKAAKVAAKKELYAQHEAEQNSFKEKYSPNVFFSESAARSHSAAYEKYVTYAPKADAKEFWDERYQAVQKDAKLKDIYDRYKKAMNELSTFLPATVQQKIGPEFLPIVRESMMSDALDIPGYFRTMGERAVRSLTANEGQEGANNRTFNKIPIQHVEAGEADIADRSKDMIGILDMFSMMATHYKYASQAKAIVDMGNTILNEENKARLAGLVQVEQNGRMVTVRDALTNTIAALKNLEDVVLYRKPKKLEGALGSRIYSETNEGQGEKFSISPWRQAAIRKTIDELLLKRQDIQKRYAEADAENPYIDEEYNKDLEEVNKELDKYSGYQFYGSKIGDKLIKIGQLKAMSYNPFSAFANVTFGMISNAIHANGGTDFSWAHFGQALKIYHAARFNKAETVKIANMMDRLGIIGDYVDSSYGNRKKFHDEIPGWKHAISPFELMRKSDFYMKAVTTIATMLKHTVEVEEGGAKKTVNLYATLNKEGYWDSEKYGERPEWHSSDPALESEWAKFQLKATRVNTIIHGNQDKANPKMLNSYILGRLIMQFRGSWLPEGWYSRFQEERYDDHLDRMVKGRYRTLGGLGFGGSLSVLGKQLLNLIPGVKVDPFTGHTIRSVDKEGNQVRTKLENSAVDVDNMRRNFAEAGFALMLTTMIVGLKHLHEKDDDKKWQYMMLMNTLIRTQQDINLYYTPAVFDQVFRNPVPAMAVLKDWGALMTASGKMIIDDDYEFSKWALKFTKAFPGLNHVSRIHTLVTKDISQLQ